MHCYWKCNSASLLFLSQTLVGWLSTDGEPHFQKPPNRILLKPIDRHFHTRRRSCGIARGSNLSFSVVAANAANANVAVVQGRLSDLYGWEDCRGNSNYSAVFVATLQTILMLWKDSPGGFNICHFCTDGKSPCTFSNLFAS